MNEQDPESVQGERDTPSVIRSPSLQSRVSNALALGLMGILGLGMLTWYYANAMTRQSRARQSVQALSSSRASGEMPLPSLGRIDPPLPAKDPAPSPQGDALPRNTSQRDLPPGDLPAALMPLKAGLLSEIPLDAGSPAPAYGAPQPKTAEQLNLERQLSGVVYSVQSVMPPAAGANLPAPPSPGAPEAGELGALLRSGAGAAVRAQMLPTQRLLLPKGAFIDCTLETAIDSTLPGMTTCVMATDTFGVDGQVVLLERGTKLIGETRGQVQQGAARVFVLWTEARTPTE